MGIMYTFLGSHNKSNKNDPFIVVERSGDFTIYYHRDTKVMYVEKRYYVCGGGTSISFTLLVDAEGKPLLYK